MARALHFNLVTDSFGNPLSGAQVNVYQPGTTIPVGYSLFLDPATATTLANPLTADSRGFFAFYTASPQTFDLAVSAPGYNAATFAGLASAVPGDVLDGATILPLTITDAEIAAANKDGFAAVPSMRTLGTGAQQAAAGNHGHTASVSSVGLTMPAEFIVAGSPVTTSGTLAVSKANQTANTVYKGPDSGGAAAPGFAPLVLADVPQVTAFAWAVGSTANPTTTSTSNVDLPDMSASITTSASGTVYGFFRTQWSINAAGVQCRFYYSVDGGGDVQLGLPHCPQTSYQTCFSALFRITGLSAGSHTVKIRWSTVSNTLTAHDTNRELLLVEVRR